MAVLDDLPGIRVTIQSHHIQQIEYPDNDDPLKLHDNYMLPPPGRIALNYVEVVADSTFLIKCEVLAPYRATEDVAFTAEVDGTRIATNLAEFGLVNTGYWFGHIDGYYKRIDSQRVSCRPLQFCGLTKVDSDDSEQVRRDSKLMAGVGDVIVYVHRTRREGPENIMVRPEPKVVKEVSEKALKGQAISHSVIYGAERQISKPQSMGTTWVDPFYRPMAVFRFRYRSKEALQAMMILPRSLTPESTQQQRNGMHRNEGSNSRQERVANLKMELARIKAEEKEEGTPQQCSKRSGPEFVNSGRAYKTSRRRDGRVVVDLTDD